jgi:hypothetical protein
VRQHGQGVRQAFLLRRVIHCDDHARAWVLAVETTRWAGNSGAKKAVDRLADARFPLAVHIVPLSHRNFGRLRKQVRSLGVQPLAIS